MENRVIKFRGLSKGKWVYGFYAHKPYGDIEQHFIIDWHINNAGCRPDTYFYDNPVIPETVGQYTGLKDKNGKEIYEGDICKYYNPEDKDGICEIEEDYALWISGTIKETNILTPLFYLKCSSEWEVIGNIYEHSHLLK